MSTTRSRLLSFGAYVALPLVGVLLLGWDWREVVLLYWFENISIGLAMVVTLWRTAHAPSATTTAAAPSAATPATTPATPATTPATAPAQTDVAPAPTAPTPPATPYDQPPNTQNMEGPVAGTFLAGFFAMHYGMFTLVHGVFVLLLVGGIMAPVESATPINWWGVLVVWVIGTAVQLTAALVGPLPRLRGTLLMFSVYPRIFALHITIILAVFVILAFQWGAAAALLLIGLHALFSGGAWMFSAARDRLATRAAPAAEPSA